jgi:hypothetical protein
MKWWDGTPLTTSLKWKGGDDGDEDEGVFPPDARVAPITTTTAKTSRRPPPAKTSRRQPPGEFARQ